MPTVRQIILEVLAKDKASGVLKGVGNSLGSMGKKLGTAVAVGAAAASAAIVKIGVDSVKVAVDFESSMARLSIAAKSTGLGLDTLQEAALAVGGDTRLLGVSASGAAESMTGLFKAGLTATEIFGDVNAYMKEGAELGGALRASIDLAAATELDMVQASDLAAITLATFGGELKTEAERADFITKAMNNFVQAADASVAEVSDLAAGLANIGPTAAAFGFSLEDTNNALAILSTRGIAGAEAGTALKSMLTNMKSPTAKTAAALEELGIELYDSAGTMKSLPVIIGSFEKALSGLTDEERDLYVQQIAGTYGMKAMQTLLAEGVTGWNDMKKATQGAAGIQEQAGKMADTLAGQWEALTGTMETAAIEMGTAFIPGLKTVVETTAALWSEHGPKVIAFVEKIGSAFGDFAKYILVAVTEGDPLNDWLTHLPEAIQPVAEALGKLFSGETTLDLAGVFERVSEAASTLLGMLTPERLTAIAETISKVVATVLKLVDAFLAMPPWAQEALVGGMVLNKVTGGGVGQVGGMAVKGLGKALGIGGGAAAAGGAGAGAAGAGAGAGAAGAAGAAGGLSALGVGAAVVGGAGLGLAGYEGLRRAGLAQENSASAQQIVAVAAHGLGKLFGGQELGQKWFSSVSGIQPGGGGQQVQVVVGIDPENGNVTAYTDQRIEQSNYQVAEELSGGNYRQEYGNR